MKQRCSVAGTDIIVDSVSTVSWGLNRVLHVYSSGYPAMSETLGKKPTIFEIEGSLNVNEGGLLARAFSAIIGSDTYQDLNDLMDTMGTKDNTNLVEFIHPTMGSWYGTILDCPFSENKSEQGIVKIRMTFHAMSQNANQNTGSLFQKITNVITGSQATGLGTIGAAFNTAMTVKSLASSPLAALTTIGSGITGLLNTSTGMTTAVSGIDSLFDGTATLGRYAQTPTVSSDILAGIDTSQSAKSITSDVTSAVTSSITDARRVVSADVSSLTA